MIVNNSIIITVRMNQKQMVNCRKSVVHKLPDGYFAMLSSTE